MAKNDLNLREWLGLLVIALAFVASAVLTIKNTQELARDAQWLAHTLEVKSKVYEVVALLLEEQSVTSAYIISGDQVYLQRLELRFERLRKELQELRVLTSDNRAHQARLDNLEPAVEAFQQALQERLQRVDERGSRSTTETDIGQRLLDDLRASLDHFREEEDLLLHKREQVQVATQQWSLIAAVLAGVVGVFLLAVFTRNLVRANAERARLVAEAFEREQWFRITLGSIGDAVVTTDAQVRVTYLNAIAEKLTGWQRAEAIGQPLAAVFNIINEFSRGSVTNPAFRAINDGMIVGLANHTILIAKDGTEHHIDDSAAPIKDARGAILGCVLIFRDIGERRSSEAATTHLAAIVASSDDAIISKNLQGIIQTWNRGAQTLFGYTAEEAIGQPATLLIPQDRQDEEPEILERIGAGTMIDHYETLRRRKDGSLVDVSLTISPIRDSEGIITGASKIARDITDRTRAEEKISTSERRMRHALTAARMGSFIYYPQEERIDPDSQMFVLFGLPPDSPLTLAMVLETLIDVGDRQRLYDGVSRSLDPGGDGLLHEEIHVIHPDGGERDLLISAHVAFEGDPPLPTRVSGVAMDITERKRAENSLRESEAFNRVVLESSPDCVKVLDIAGNVVSMNSNGLRQMEIDDFSVFKGRLWQTLWPEESRGEVARALEEARTSGSGRFVHACPTAKGTLKWWDVSVAPIRNDAGTVNGFVSVSRDISAQRLVDETLRENEQRLRQQAADLSDADRRKNEFLAMLAHELRNPLAPIRNTIELLGMSGNDDADRNSALRMMARQTDQLARLVDDLLDVSRVSQGKIALRTSVLDLTSVMLHAVESAKPAAIAAGQTLEVLSPQQPVHVEGDDARLKQVVDNLLNNAMKFTPHGGLITLKTERTDTEAVVEVQDNGIGISPDEIGRVFGLFVQSDSSLVRSTSGLGIGLTLVKTLVEMHGGSITARSQGEGMGSTFIVRLPLVPDSAVTATATLKGFAAPPAQRRILVVDDNRDAARSLVTLLARSGHTVSTAFDGLEGVATAAAFQPEVILLDIGLPQLNGYEVAKRIRQEAWGRDIFLIALTGWGQDEDRNKSREAGFDMHLVKPVDLTLLKTLLTGPLERSN